MPMRAQPAVRPLRMGTVTVAPGQMRTVMLPLPGRSPEKDALPVVVAVGRRPGPRITLVAAPRGFEAGAARAAREIAAALAPETRAGSVVVVPVLRPGGRFAARGEPVPTGASWQFPGDAG